MKYFEIAYYRTHCWIDNKYVKDEYVQGAINKARVKDITSIEEITEEEYRAGLDRQNARAQAKRERRAELEKYIV